MKPPEIERLRKLSRTAANRDISKKPEESCELLDRNKLYTTVSLCASLGVGHRFYVGLIEEGLPRTLIKGRYFFSGRLVLEWIENQSVSLVEEVARKGGGK